ncbi:S41 family peptidase [Ekhidna sp.]|jgi:carboxyl-terminal processing protease|uniref:S41 family peptidase n=1 Tax=Ekhidna sp. TaxID=2608089 RepID=UPI0032EADB7F
MKHSFIMKYLAGLFLVFTVGCKNDDGPGISVELQNEVNEFVWFGMNGYYYWVDEVEDLSVEKYPTYNSLYAFLNTYSQPEDLFDDLIHPDDFSASSGKPFSWIVDDYEELEASFQGISKSFGYELGLLRIASGSDDLVAYVKYVIPGGPAANAGIMRGDVFTEVNGTQLTEDNYLSLLFGNENITITLAQIQDNTISSTDQEISLIAVDIAENPILISDVLELDGVKIGYLVYNQFVNNNTYHEEMNDAFGEFKSAGINDLVLDLRYNGGGSVKTSVMLASIIYGAGGSNDIFTISQYNHQIEQSLTSNGVELNEYFISSLPDSNTPLNRLSLNRVFILTSGNTASASELIISGLDPYIDITLIGTTTVGKNLGSTTLYDSPNFRKTPDNSDVNHTNSTYAIQPIITRFTNIEDIDYRDGFEPNIEVSEINYLEDLPALGDPSEPLLAEALGVITGVARLERKPDSGMQEIETMQDKRTNTILIDNKEILSEIRDHFVYAGQ